MSLGFQFCNNCFNPNSFSLTQVVNHRDIRIWWSSNFPSIHPYQALAKKVFYTSAMIKQRFIKLSMADVHFIYKTYILSILEYVSSTTYSSLMNYYELLDCVQWKANKLVVSPKQLPYERRLNRLNLRSLPLRQVRGDNSLRSPYPFL